MVKRHTTLNVEDDLIKKAKEKFLNISEITEQAIREKLGEVEVTINTLAEKCDFCGREEEKATRDNLKGLVWLWPDERWICDKCLKETSRKLNAN